LKETVKHFPFYLAKPAQRILAQQGITELYDLCRFTKAEIKNLHGIGPDAMVKIKNDLFERSLKFKADPEAYQRWIKET
jgi:DNA-directed RNA polymerase alpha subunit